MAKTKKEFEGFDRVFPLIGGHHLYQWLLLLVVGFQRGVLVLHHIAYIFLGVSPAHWCFLEEFSSTATTMGWNPDQIRNISIPKTKNGAAFAECEYYDLDYAKILRDTPRYEEALAGIDYTSAPRRECSRWAYDESIFESTVVTRFDLVCNRKHLVATIQATYMAGIFVGSFLLGALSDRVLGRRRTALLCFATIITFGFLTAFTPSYSLFLLCRFMIAVGVAGSTQNCYTILMEYSDSSCRATLGLFTQVAFAIFYMLLPVYAYAIREWTHLQLAFSVSTLALVGYYWLLPESSRWLAQNGRTERALDILEGIAKVNRMPRPSRAVLKQILTESCHPPGEPEQETEANQRPSASRASAAWSGFKKFLSSYPSLVRTRELRRRSFLIWFLYLASSFSYYGVSFGSPALSRDPFIIVFFAGLMEIPGYLGVIPLVTYWGRKPTTIMTFLVAGMAYLLIVFTDTGSSALRITFAMISKLFISGCQSVIILLAAELYPTESRSTGMGLAVLWGRIGSMTAPYVVRAEFAYEGMPIVIIACMALAAGLCSFLLPETKGEELREKVDALESAVKAKRGGRGRGSAVVTKRVGEEASIEMQCLNNACKVPEVELKGDGGLEGGNGDEDGLLVNGQGSREGTQIVKTDDRDQC